MKIIKKLIKIISKNDLIKIIYLIIENLLNFKENKISENEPKMQLNDLNLNTKQIDLSVNNN